MKLLVGSAIIFFGTLLAAALVALGEPGATASRSEASHAGQASPVLDAAWSDQP